MRLNLFVEEQLCRPKVRDFAMGLRARKFAGAFEKRAPGPYA